MADTAYTYTKTPVAADRLEQDIRASAIVTSLASVTTLGSTLTITFRDTLIQMDQTILDTIIANHTGVPLTYAQAVTTVAVQSQPDPVPFAQPTYRTKRDAIAALVPCARNTSADIPFKVVSERYVSGGTLIVENAEMGDWVEAYVGDNDGVIPAPYRAALCEAWPVVASYIAREYVNVREPGSIFPGTVSVHDIVTYPLNARITAGLYLCIVYHAVDVGLIRRVGVNYNLTKKL